MPRKEIYTRIFTCYVIEHNLHFRRRGVGTSGPAGVSLNYVLYEVIPSYRAETGEDASKTAKKSQIRQCFVFQQKRAIIYKSRVFCRLHRPVVFRTGRTFNPLKVNKVCFLELFDGLNVA